MNLFSKDTAERRRKLSVNTNSAVIRWVRCILIICSVLACLVFAAGRFRRAAEQTTDEIDPTFALGMYTGKTASQAIKGYEGTLTAFAVRFGTYERVNRGQLVAAFYKNDKALGSWLVQACDLADNKYQEFRFPKAVRLKKDSTYRIEITRVSDDPLCDEEADKFAIWTTDGGGGLFHESEDAFGRMLCYQLTFFDGVLYRKILLLFLPVCFLLCLTAGLFFLRKGFGRSFVLRLALAGISVLALTQMLSYDLLNRVNTLAVVQPFSEEYESCAVPPLETWTSAFSADTVPFSSIDLAFAAGSKNRFRLSLENTDTGETYIDREILGTGYIESGSMGRILRLTARNEREGLEAFPVGHYTVTIRNMDENNEIRVVVRSEEKAKRQLRRDIRVDPEEEAIIEETAEEETAEEGSPEKKQINVQLTTRSGLGFMIAGVCLIIALLYLACVLGLTNRGGWRFSPTSFFTLTASSLGLIYMIVLLPWSVPDSENHFVAAYRYSSMPQNAENEWKARQEDADLYDLLWKKNPDLGGYYNVLHWKDHQLRTEGTDEIPHYYYMKYYSPLNYLPLVIGLKAGRMLGLGSVPAVYLGRVLMFLAFLLLCRRAIAVTPVGKSIFAGIALLPFSMMVSSGYSYDGMVMISSLCFTACILRLLHEPSRRRHLAEAMLWAAVLGGVKGGGYLLLLILCLLFIVRYRQKGVVFMLPVLAAGLLSVLLFDVILPSDALFQLGEAGTGKLAASFALTHPLKYAGMMLQSYLDYTDSLLLGLGAGYLSWLQNVVPGFVIAAIFGLVSVQSLLEEDRLSFGKNEKWILILTVALTFITTPAMLLSWTSAASRRIEGLQGRYFLPVLPLLFFLLTKFGLRKVVSRSAGSAMPDELNRNCVRWLGILFCVCVYYMLRFYMIK